jgi:hypothetical protein
VPSRRGAVDTASASGTERPGFEPRQGLSFFRNSYNTGVNVQST